MLNMIECTDIYLKKQSAEHARILDVPDAVYSITSLYELLYSYQNRDLFRTLLNIL